MSAKTAGVVAIAASGGALVVLLIYLPAVMFKIQEINEQVIQDSKEFRFLAHESWQKFTQVYGPDVGRRLRRQISKGKIGPKIRDPRAYGQDGYGTGPSRYTGPSDGYSNPGYGVNNYGKSEAVYAHDICANPAMDAALEKAQQCGCNANRNCPAGPPGPPGRPGDDGQPGYPGKQGKSGLPGTFPPVTIECEDDHRSESYGVNAGTSSIGYGKSRSKRQYGDSGGYSRPSYGISSHGTSGYGGKCCRVCTHGPNGPPGPPGTPGSCGDKGYPGPPGRDAENGRDGLPGQPGKQGQPGKTGQMGKPGNPGTPGIKGLKGPPGKKGSTGESGQKGPIGFSGKDGQDGNPGAAGATGPNGYPGDKGEDGKPGQRGPPGEPGQDAHYCPCPERGSTNAAVQQYGGDQGYGQQHPSETSGYDQHPSAPVHNYQHQEAQPYEQPTQGSGYVQRAAHGAVLEQPSKPENFLPPGYDAASEAVKSSPYFSRLAKLKRLRQAALKAKS